MSRVTKSEKDFMDKCRGSGVVVVGEYAGATTGIEVIGSCGHTITRTPQVIKKSIAKTGKVLCRSCRYSEQGDRSRLNESEVLSLLTQNTSAVITSSYANIDKQMEFICDCGEKFTRSAYSAKSSIEKYGRNICKECIKKKTPPPNKLSIKKIRNTCEKYNAKLISDDYSSNRDTLTIVGSCGHTFNRRWSSVSHSISLYGQILCQHCGMRQESDIKKTSAGEDEVAEYIRSIGFDVERSKRPAWAQGKEIDIQIPSKNVAVEYNGEYWHSEEMGTGKMYHANKSNNAASAGVHLLHVFETEWMRKKEIVKSMIQAKLGATPNKIYARKCEVRRMAASEARDFFDKNHLQGGNGATNNSFGLYLNNKLVAAISFRRPRFSKEYDLELYRYASIINTSVVGGFSRLLKAGIAELPFTTMVTYADLRYSSIESNVYKSTGFSFKQVSPPGYYYFKQGTGLLNRVGYQKHKLKNKLDIFDPNKTEVENMRDNGFKRVWDCGSAVYTLSRT